MRENFNIINKSYLHYDFYTVVNKCVRNIELSKAMMFKVLRLKTYF